MISAAGGHGRRVLYFQLAERLAMNLDERGIEFEHRPSAAADKRTPASLADEKDV